MLSNLNVGAIAAVLITALVTILSFILLRRINITQEHEKNSSFEGVSSRDKDSQSGPEMITEDAHSRPDENNSEAIHQEHIDLASNKINDLETRLKIESERLKTNEAIISDLNNQIEQLLSKSDNLETEFELCILQLNQVQHELERYFTINRRQQALLDEHAAQQKRVQKLLSSIIKRAQSDDL